MNKRIGPQMQRAVDIVRANPGCTIKRVADQLHIGSSAGTNCALGYDPVHRAMRAGLIRHNPERPHRRGTYALEVVEVTE